MKKIALPLSLLILLSWALLQPAGVLDLSASFMALRKAYTSLTGALALGWMGFSMLLALHPAWLENSLGGLDRLYRVHKWVGITAVLLVVVHWLLILSPRTLASWGLIAVQARGRHGHGGAGGGGGALTGTAREMGEWAAWLMIALGIVALLRFVPYEWFRKLHKGFPVAFLIGAYHSVVLLPHGAAATPFGLLVTAIAIGGSVIALMSLSGKIGESRKSRGVVTRALKNEAGILELSIRPTSRWPGHKAGQFALLTFDDREGSHPFTIASHWEEGAELRFVIKPLGDYTRALPDLIASGAKVTIEGPYGSFDFGNGKEDQVWIAGGIGIAPFLARLHDLIGKGGVSGSTIHFFYCVRSLRDARFPTGLQTLCDKAGVKLHLRVSEQEGWLDPQGIAPYIQNKCSVWFCGPLAWADSLRETLRQHFGLAANRFHHEVFEFR